MNITQNSFHCSSSCPLFPEESRIVSFFGHKQQTIAKKAEHLFDSFSHSPDEATKKLLVHSFSHLTQTGKKQPTDLKTLTILLDHLTTHYENTHDELLFLAQHIDILPSVASLQKTISQKSSLLSQALIDTKEKLSILQTWKDLHLDMSLLETDFESVQFLVRERLIYTIVGLRNTSLEGKDQIHVEQGKIFIKCNNIFTPVGSLIKRFKYVKEDLQYREKETNLAWNYLLPQGLVQIDRTGSKDILPITRLTTKEKESLLKHAQQFEGIQFSKENPPVGVFQIITNPRKLLHLKESFLTDGIDAHTPVHVGFRFIDEKGNVYSSGFGSTAEEDTYCTGKHNYLASINGMPSTTDYEEFRPNEGRRVTSVPLSKEGCDALRKEVTQMRQRSVRFNILIQNCSLMATRLLEVVGITIHHDSSAYTFLRGLLPSLTSSSTLLHMTQKVLFNKRRPYARFAINRQATTNKIRLAIHRKRFFQTVERKIHALLPKKIQKRRSHSIRTGFFKLLNAARRRNPNNFHAGSSTS